MFLYGTAHRVREMAPALHGRVDGAPRVRPIAVLRAAMALIAVVVVVRVATTGAGPAAGGGAGAGDTAARRNLAVAEQLSWSPRLFRFPGILSREECEYMRSLAEPHLMANKFFSTSSYGEEERTEEGTMFDYTLVKIKDTEPRVRSRNPGRGRSR